MLLMLVVSFFVIIFSLKLIDIYVFWTSISSWYGRWETGVIGAALLIISIRFIVPGLKPKQPAESTIKTSEIGSVSISLAAVESLVLKLIREIEKIKDVKVKIRKSENGVSILLRMVVTHDVKIPELSTELQKDVKEHIETATGLIVSDVSIKVDNVYNPSLKQQRSIK